MALRGGLRVPNSATFAPDYETAQPDQGDFLILGNGQYGVVSGCNTSLSGTTVSIGAGPNLVVINDSSYFVGGGQTKGVSQPLSGQTRWDLVVFDRSDGFSIVPGTSVSTGNPALPDVTDSMVVLAAVYIPSSGALRLVDKRNFLSTTLSTYNASTLIANYSSPTNVTFSLSGTGRLRWNDGDTALERKSAGVIKISDELETGTINATVAGFVLGDRIITAKDIEWGPIGSRPVNGTTGQIWVNTNNGDSTIWRIDTDTVAKWMPLSDVAATGDIVMSMLPPTSKVGWLPLWGQSVSQIDAGGLWDLFPSWHENGLLRLPDYRGRMPVGAGVSTSYPGGAAGDVYGTPTSAGGAVSVTLTRDHMPTHRHVGQGVNNEKTGSGGDHNHSGTTDGPGGGGNAGGHTHTVTTSGSHAHTVNDGGHYHFSTRTGDPMVAAEWNGTIDTQPHGIIQPWYNGAPSNWVWVRRTANATSGAGANLTVSGGGHTHTVSSGGVHSHNFSTNNAPSHTHPLPPHVSEGGSQPFTVQPPTGSVNFYIKT
jgi:hypothetical protein